MVTITKFNKQCCMLCFPSNRLKSTRQESTQTCLSFSKCIPSSVFQPQTSNMQPMSMKNIFTFSYFRTFVIHRIIHINLQTMQTSIKGDFHLIKSQGHILGLYYLHTLHDRLQNVLFEGEKLFYLKMVIYTRNGCVTICRKCIIYLKIAQQPLAFKNPEERQEKEGFFNKIESRAKCCMK